MTKGATMDANNWGSAAGGGLFTACAIGIGKWLLKRFQQDGVDELKGVLFREDLLGVRDDLKSVVNDLRTHAVHVARLDDAVAMAAKALDTIATKQEKLADASTDHAATLRLLGDNVTLMRQRLDQSESGFKDEILRMREDLAKFRDRLESLERKAAV